MPGPYLKYFVTKPKGTDIYAQASRAAMLAYAGKIADEDPQYAIEIEEWELRERREAEDKRP